MKTRDKYCAALFFLFFAAAVPYIHCQDPTPYIYESFIDLDGVVSGESVNARDIAADYTGNLYITDANSGAILVINTDGSLVNTIEHKDLINPEGVSISPADGIIYVADAGAQSIFLFSIDGSFIKQLHIPQDINYAPFSIHDAGYVFRPVKAISDDSGQIYVIGDDAFTEILILSSEGALIGFFQELFKTRRNSGRLINFVPFRSKLKKALFFGALPTSDLMYDGSMYIYTVTRSIPSNQLKRLSLLGSNTFADQKTGGSRQFPNVSNMASLDVNRKGIIAVLDDVERILIHYSSSGSLLFTVDLGDKDILTAPGEIAFSRKNDDLYVLDPEISRIAVLRPSNFGHQVFQASELTAEGLHTAALKEWSGVLDEYPSYHPALRGLAQALRGIGMVEKNEDYIKTAMEYYRQLDDREGYSHSLNDYRILYLNTHRSIVFLLLLIPLAVALVLGGILKNNKKRRPTEADFRSQSAITLLIHPFETMEGIAYHYSVRTMVSALGTVIFFIAASIVFYYGRSFHFTLSAAAQPSLFLHIITTLFPLVCWIAVHYCFIRFFKGERKITKVFSYCSFSLVPIILAVLLSVLLSYVLTLQEKAVLIVLYVIFGSWSYLLLSIGIRMTHKFSTKKTLLIQAISTAVTAVPSVILFLL